MKKTVSLLMIALACASIVSCDNEDNKMLPADISNIRAEEVPGNIVLKWDLPEDDKTVRYIEVRYFDHLKKMETMRTSSLFTGGITIPDTRQKFGEYNFRIQPFSFTYTGGNVHTFSTVSGKAPATKIYSSIELAIAPEHITIFKPVEGDVSASLLDGNVETFVNTDYNSTPSGPYFYYYDIKYPKEQTALKFSYINRNNAAASFPGEIKCYVKKEVSDEWTLIKTLTAAEDGLPTAVLGSFGSKEYDSPFPFKYFRFSVPKTHTGKANFSLAEFRIFDVTVTVIDPEAEE